MAEQLSAAARAAYLAAGGTKCPFCGGDQLTGSSGEFGVNARQAVSCDACDATWTDVYTLVGVELIDGPKPGTTLVERPPTREEQAEALVAKLEAAGFDLSVLDEYYDDRVHDAKGSEAADINNGGLASQIEFILDCDGQETIESIEAELREELTRVDPDEACDDEGE